MAITQIIKKLYRISRDRSVFPQISSLIIPPIKSPNDSIINHPAAGHNPLRLYFASKPSVKKHFPDLPEEDIRDILQEVWTSLLNAIDKLYDKGDEGQFAWLIKVTQTKVIDYYRSQRKTEELGERIGLALQEQKEGCSVQDTVIARMIAMELVEGLTEKERRVLSIEYFSDTNDEVSNAFKCRRSRLRRKIEESFGVFRKKR